MSAMLSVLIFFSVFVTVVSVGMILSDIRESRKRRALEELAGSQLHHRIEFLESKSEKKTVFEKLSGGAIDIGRLESLLMASDTPLSAERFIFISLVPGLLLFVVFGMLFKNILLAFMMPIVGITGPVYYLILRRRKREETLVRQLPEALDMISRSLRIGQALDKGFRELGGNFPNPLGGEVKTIYEEIAMGIPFDAALRNFEQRFPRVAEIKMFSTALIIQRETGGNLTRVLDGLSRMIRERFKLRRQVQALTSEGRASAAILGLLPFGFMGVVWISNPGYLGLLFNTVIGRKLLVSAIILEVIGFFVMRQVSKIDI